MAVPEGYTALAKIGIAYKGYDPETTYSQLDAVYYNGSTYVALLDNPAGPPSADGTNWQYLAQGFLSQVIGSLTATDTEGIVGEAGSAVNAQALLDGMAGELSGKLDKTGDVANTTVTFSDATSRTNIASGEKQGAIMGKIKKWFADLTVAAFAQVITSYPDLMANTLSGYLVDALAVKQGFTELNSNFAITYNDVAGGYDHINMGTFRIGSIQQITCIIGFPISVANASEYFTIAFATETPLYQDCFSGTVAYGSKVIPALFRIDLNKNIQVFLSSELIAFGGVSVTAYLKTNYKIKE